MILPSALFSGLIAHYSALHSLLSHYKGLLIPHTSSSTSCFRAFALAVLMLLHGSCPHFLHVLTPFHASPSHEVFLATRIFSFSTLPIPFLLDFFFYLFSTVFSAAKANILPVLFTALSSAHSAALVHNMRSVFIK